MQEALCTHCEASVTMGSGIYSLAKSMSSTRLLVGEISGGPSSFFLTVIKESQESNFINPNKPKFKPPR